MPGNRIIRPPGGRGLFHGDATANFGASTGRVSYGSGRCSHRADGL